MQVKICPICKQPILDTQSRVCGLINEAEVVTMHRTCRDTIKENNK